MPAKTSSSPILYPESRLRAISTLDGRYKDKVEELEPYASEMGLIAARVEVEALHFLQLSEFKVLRFFTKEEKDFLLKMGPNLTLLQAQRVKELEAVSNHDVQAVEKMMREELQKTSLKDVISYSHFLLTSEDDNNLAYRLMIKRGVQKIVIPMVDKIIDALINLAEKEKDTVIPARTHGQEGVPSTLGKEISVFAVRLNKELRKLEKTQLTGKLNGAVGNFNAHVYSVPDIDWQDYAKKFVEKLGFIYNPFTTQINSYEDLIEMFQIFQRLNGILLDMDQDIWRYISDDWFTQIAKSGETGSSTMAQKINPIKFENSEGNIAMANGLFESMGRKLSVSRLQRDLSDSTVIRNAPTAIGFSLLSYISALEGLSRINPNHAEIKKALDKDWGMLTEGVQVYLRLRGREDAYDMVKNASRGKHIDSSNFKDWVNGLDVDEEDKEHLKKLTPENYVGIASKIASQAIEEIKSSRKKTQV